MGFFLVLKAEVVRGMIQMRRYWFASVVGLVVGYVTLIGMVYAFVQTPGLVGVGGQVTDMSVGFLIGMFAFGILGLFSQNLQAMASAGQLEQVCMSPHGLVTNFLARSLVAAVSTIMSCGIMIALIAFTMHGTIHASPGPLFIVLFLTYANLIGFGFMVGGLVLIFKQIGQIVTLFRMGMFFLAIKIDAAFFEDLPWAAQIVVRILPGSDAAICLKLALLDGMGWEVLGTQYFFFLIINAAVWTSVGITCFRLMENWSRHKGTLGAY